ERTTIPRTTPRLRRTRRPGSSKAVVTFSWGTIPASYVLIDLDHRFILLNYGQQQTVLNPIAARAQDRGLREIAALDHGPFFVKEQIGAAGCREIGEPVRDAEGLPQRYAQCAEDPVEIVAGGSEDTRPRPVSWSQEVSRFVHPGAAALRV